MAAFDGRLYVMGGAGVSITYEDIWSSADSAAWQQVTISASWGAWSSHAVAVLQNTLFLSGGGETNDVWSSTDGKNWVREPNSMGGGARSGFGAFSYNGRLYIMGGAFDHNVWSSVDGVEWRQETASPNWSDRENFAVSILPSE